MFSKGILLPYYQLMLTKCSSAYHSGSTPTATSYWKPRAELIHPDFSTLTLIFVSSLRISYKKWSDDPIFPADKEVFLPGERKPWFRNSDPRARPLACINYIEVCLADGKTCWPMNADQPPDAVTPPEFWLMFASLRRTDIYNAIEKRLGRGLIAQSKVSQFFSEALGDQHWVDEVERLVATSHAMTQINAWSIASGEDSVHEGRDGYVLITPEEKYGNLCRMFKYNPPGYASIYFEPFIGILLTFPIIFILSRKWPLWPWKNETSNSVEVEPQLSDAGGVGQEELIPQSADPAPTGSETEVTRTEAGSEPLDARAVGQEEPTSEPAATAATGSHTEETTTGEVGRAEPSGPSSASVALGSGQEPPTPRPTEMVVSQNTETGGATTGIPTDTSADVEWEPLLIEKIIQLLVFLVWPWPLKAYEWLRYSSIAIWRE
jgi:hypothetical protein